MSEVPRAQQVDQHPREPAFVRDPYALYRRIHALDAPVFWSHYDCWCVARYTDVDRLLRDRRLSRVPPGGFPSWPEHLTDFARVEAGSLLALEPPAHTALRKRVTPAFLGKRIAALEPAFRARCHAEIDRLLADGTIGAGKPFDLIREYASPLPVALITRLIGVPEHDGPQLIDWSSAMVRIYTETASETEQVDANIAAGEFDRYVRRHIADKRRKRDDTLLSSLCHDHGHDHDGEPLDDADIVSLTILLLNAGHEATVHQLGNLVHALLAAPEAAAPLRSGCHDPDYLDAVVEEGLRHDPPLHLFFRYAIEPLDIGNDIVLSVGERIALLLGAANHDPARWCEPSRFRVDREIRAHTAFGAGRHFCAGAGLARLELSTAVAVLFERLPTLELHERPQYADRFHFRGLEALHVRSCGTLPSPNR